MSTLDLAFAYLYELRSMDGELTSESAVTIP